MAEKTKKKTKKSLRVKKEIVKKFQERSKKEEKDNKVVDRMRKTKISVIGIGGGGGSIVSEIASGLSRVNFVAANTDIQALKIINKKVNRFPFGQKLTQGLGTGMNVDLAREAAQDEKDKIEKVCQGQDLCIIVACLGGGTGSGAASVFAKISKSLGNLTYGIFTLPFEFEGEKKMEIAKDALKKIKSHLDAITLIPNERVFQIIDKAIPLRQALSVVNKSLAKGLEGLIEAIYEPGLINIDFADFKTVFKNKGKISYLNTVETSTKESSLKDLMAQVLNSPLYPYTIQGAKGVLFNISGEKNLSLSEVNQISKSILELVNPEAKIIFGTRILASKKHSEPIIKTTLLAIGCEPKRGIKKRFVCYKKDKEEQVIKPKIKKLAKKNSRRDKVFPLRRPQPTSRLRKRKIKIKKEKVKVEIVKKPEKKIPTELLINKVNPGTKIKPTKAVEENKFSSSVRAEHKPSEAAKRDETSLSARHFARATNERVRKSGLQIKEEAQEFEKEILEKERFWEAPAFLRRKSIK